MEGKRDRAVVGKGIRLLAVKVVLGAIAAGVGIALMRPLGGGEIVVAVLIGLVPGIVERSLKKLVFGALLAVVGYTVGARIGAGIAKTASGVPLGHWAVTGAFIGMTAGISRLRGQWFSFRFLVWSLGAAYGFLLGLVFGVFGDIGGFFTVPATNLPFYYYMREISLLCAGIFISLGAGIASILADSLDNGLWRVARAVEKAEA